MHSPRSSLPHALAEMAALVQFAVFDLSNNSLVHKCIYLCSRHFLYLVLGTRPFFFSFLLASLKCFGWIGPLVFHCFIMSHAMKQIWQTVSILKSDTLTSLLTWLFIDE